MEKRSDESDDVALTGRSSFSGSLKEAESYLENNGFVKISRRLEYVITPEVDARLTDVGFFLIQVEIKVY